jgi:hypothetical protein
MSRNTAYIFGQKPQINFLPTVYLTVLSFKQAYRVINKYSNTHMCARERKKNLYNKVRKLISTLPAISIYQSRKIATTETKCLYIIQVYSVMAIFNIFLLSLNPPQQQLSHTTYYKTSILIWHDKKRCICSGVVLANKLSPVRWNSRL